MDRGNACFIGLESIPATEPRDCFPYLKAHLLAIQNTDRFRKTQFIAFIEKNNTWQCNEISRFLKSEFPDIIIPDKQGLDTSMISLVGSREERRSNVGVYTGADVKEDMCLLFKSFLEDERLSFFKDLITTYCPNKEIKDQQNAAQQVKRMLRGQLESYFIQTTIQTNPAMQKEKYTYSGKSASGKSKDDLAVVVQLAIYWAESFKKNRRLQTNMMEA